MFSRILNFVILNSVF